MYQAHVWLPQILLCSFDLLHNLIGEHKSTPSWRDDTDEWRDDIYWGSVFQHCLWWHCGWSRPTQISCAVLLCNFCCCLNVTSRRLALHSQTHSSLQQCSTVTVIHGFLILQSGSPSLSSFPVDVALPNHHGNLVIHEQKKKINKKSDSLFSRTHAHIRLDSMHTHGCTHRPTVHARHTKSCSWKPLHRF